MKKIYFEKKGFKVNSMDIDYLLWNLGEKVCNEILPHHRVTTIFY